MKTVNQEQLQTIAGGLTQDQINWIEDFFRGIGRPGPTFPIPTPDNP